MIKINWAKDYKREFACPHCGKKDIRLRGTRNNKRQFFCNSCRKNIVSSIDIISRKDKKSKNTIKVDWKQDYKNDFDCPKCSRSGMSLIGVHREKTQFKCNKCKTYSVNSCYINYRSRYLDSRLQDGEIDWGKDYHGEFVCPHCNTSGMSAMGIHKVTTKRQFRCSQCRKTCQQSSQIKIKAVSDPINPEVTWYKGYRVPGFVYPNCEEENIVFSEISVKNYNKKHFRCRSCEKKQYDSVFLNKRNFSRFSSGIPHIKPFDFTDDEWDLRSIIPDSSSQDVRKAIVDFEPINPGWYKSEVKKYIYHISKNGISKSFGSINGSTYALRRFANYLIKNNIASFDDIDRSLLLDYLAKEETVGKSKLTPLRNFFTIGTFKGWFKIDQDIIRDEDYPKTKRGNPNPISTIVREQIEENLHKLPEPIARMWIICFFAALRPEELAFLKQDCLVQEGDKWKVVWQRNKSDDIHEVPINRTVAKVIQEQKDYIQDLWGDEWQNLFCHYHGLSKLDLYRFNLEPIKRTIPTGSDTPLKLGIRALIKDLNIKNENGKLAKFTPKVLRPSRATHLFEQGHELAVVSAWLGHKHFATTSTYYTKVSCELIEQEAGHIQRALVNSDGHRLPYESFPKSFWEKPQAHKLELSGTHINTPIYGYCGLDLDQDCHKFRACYTCGNFVATPEKLPQYAKTRDELRGKQSKALAAGQDVLVEQFGTQADQLDKIIASLQEAA